MKSETINVLLIEDDEDDYILTRELLAEVKGGKYTLEWASSYEEGLRIAGRREHHVCLVDYRLGERSGVDLIREARKFGLTTPMILLTGQGNRDVDVEAIEAGATDYLVKDETPASRLERTIRYAVQLDTERKQADLVRLQAAALESADNAILITSHDGTITWVNSAFSALTGYASGEVLGQNPRILKSGQHDAAFYKSMWETLCSGQVWRGEMTNKRKDGSTFIEEQTITPVLSETGEITNFIAIKKDITARKLIEVELEHARDAALESVRLKSEFLANMSHEIRTPMNGIIGVTELVLDSDLDEQQRHYIETIASSAESLLTIIDDILDFSKIEAGLLTFETVAFDLRLKVESLLDLMSERVRVKDLDMSLIFDADLPTNLCGDPTRLHQILTNLVGNAIKFTERGKVVVKVSKQSERDERVTIRFDVKDTGIGISESDQKKLFAPFVQADGSVTRRYGGTGLGLVIAKQLVEMMGGTISFTSDPDHGSIFSFTASFIKQTSQERAAQAAEVNLKDRRVLKDRRSVVRGAKPAEDNKHFINKRGLNPLKVSVNRCVLLVEDNDVNQMVAGDQLASLGYSVDVASNGQEALDALSLKSYDVVLMDCGMPVMDGYTATAEIRRREGEGGPTPIIAMTAHAMKGDREKCLAAGMDGYIAKPVKRKTLEGIFATLFQDGNLSSAQVDPAVISGVSVIGAKGNEDDSSVVDLVCLRDIASTPEKLQHIIKLYLSHTRQRLEELRIAISHESAADIYAIAHKCLGSSRTCGMTAIVPALTELQRMGKADELKGAADQFSAAEVAFQKLQPFLERYVEQLRA
jgi:two-component system sensor histidine kinase/response regulator